MRYEDCLNDNIEPINHWVVDVENHVKPQKANAVANVANVRLWRLSTSEWLIYGTIDWGRGLFGLVISNALTWVWMVWLWGQYVS